MAQANGFNFQKFKTQMRTAARGNQYRVDLHLPTAFRTLVPGHSQLEDTLSYKAKSSAVPALNLPPIEVAFRGRKFKMAGDRDLDPWSCEIYLTNGLPERGFFEAWQTGALGVEDSSRFSSANIDYFADASLYQLDQNGNIMQSYRLEGIYPSLVGEVGFDAENSEALLLPLTFEVNDIKGGRIR